MKSLKVLSVSVIAGIAVTLASGLVLSTPAQLVGASWYGYPLSWIIKMVIAPQYNPWKINYTALILDIFFWSIVAYILLYIKNMASRRRK